MNITSSSLALAAGPFFLFAIIMSALIIRKNSDKLDTPEFIQKFGVLTDGLFTMNAIARYWTVLTLVRWLTLCVIIIVLDDYPQF